MPGVDLMYVCPKYIYRSNELTRFAVRDSYGPMLVGVLLNCVLYGVSCRLFGPVLYDWANASRLQVMIMQVGKVHYWTSGIYRLA